MADAITEQNLSPAAPATSQPAGANVDSAAARANLHAKDAAAASHAAAAASFDALLANEARANVKRSRIAARDDLVKYKPRIPVPPAKIVIRPVRAHPWRTPFIALAVVVGISTCLSAGGIAYLFLRPMAAATASEAEIRSLRDTLTQLRRNVAELSVNVTTNRNALDAATRKESDRIARTASIPALTTERSSETVQILRAPVPEAAADITGSVQPPPSPPPVQRDVLAGWHIRRAYDGAAVLEGKLGVIEVNLGQDVPGLGRIQEIKLDNGRWQILTSKGVILSTR